MADIRVKVAKDKASLVKALRAGDGSSGLFNTYVDIMIFAASLGIKNQLYMPIVEFSRKDPDPIPWEHFESRGQIQLISLIAISHTHDPNILSHGEDAIESRKEIFENYANGGLNFIHNTLKGIEEYSNQVILLLLKERAFIEAETDSLDLNFLLH